MYVPDGCGTVFPCIFARHAADYLAFLKAAFGAVELGVTTMPTGGIANARMRIGTTSFMVSEASERFPASSAAFYIYVENADAACDQAVAAGAALILAPMDMDYGDRQGGVTDPSGNIWWVSQRVQREPYD
jgi:PhnB protein